eukprot:9411339-Pyramimonas_sp.AAC.2
MPSMETQSSVFSADWASMPGWDRHDSMESRSNRAQQARSRKTARTCSRWARSVASLTSLVADMRLIILYFAHTVHRVFSWSRNTKQRRQICLYARSNVARDAAPVPRWVVS